MTGALIYYMCLVYLFGTPLRNLATLSFNHIFVVTLSVVCGELRERVGLLRQSWKALSR